MAKKKEIKRVAKLEFLAGKSKPGPELAGLGIVMPEFTKQFNDETRDRGNEPVPVTITVFTDKSFKFKTHTAPASYKIKQAAKLEKGSSNAKTTKIATITKEQIREIAEYKLPDMNTNKVESAMSSIAGTAKQMGVLVEGMEDVKAAIEAAQEAKKAEVAAVAKEAQLAAAEAENIENKDKEIEVNATSQKDDQESSNDGKKKEGDK